MRAILLALSVLMLVSACSAASSGPQRGSRTLITQEEIESVNARSAWEVVQILRPEFLQMGAVTAMQTARQDDRVVFLDGRRMGPVEELRNIPTTITITSIRLFSASEATERWGAGFRAGVIEVRTRQ